MAAISDEELRRLVSENRDRILEIVSEAVPSGEDVDKAFSRAEKAAEKVSGVKGRAEDAVKEAYSALMAPEVHRHFIRMGMEFFMGLNALAERMPVPEKVRKVREDMSEAETGIRREMCRTNPDCPRKPDDGGLERIEIE